MRQNRILVAVLAAASLAASLLVVPASPGQAETLPHRIARLRAAAGAVRHRIDSMNAQVEALVESYDANQEALARTTADQAATTRRIAATEQRLAASERQLADRFWAIYTGGPVSGLAEVVGATSIEDALTTAKYQERVVADDDALIAEVDQERATLGSLAAAQAAQRAAEEGLKARLGRQRTQIQSELAAQRAYLGKLTRAVKRAVAEQRRREEAAARAALARKLAAERAARLRAERAQAAARARAAASARAASSASTSTSAASAALVRAPGDAAAHAVAFALAQLGKPYAWGAIGPGSYDCSGLTMTAYRHAGVLLPRTAAEQWYAGRRLDLVDLRPGDLLFFATDLRDPATIHHVTMYIGHGMMVEAPYTGARVRVVSIARSDMFGAVRPTG